MISSVSNSLSPSSAVTHITIRSGWLAVQTNPTTEIQAGVSFIDQLETLVFNEGAHLGSSRNCTELQWYTIMIKDRRPRQNCCCNFSEHFLLGFLCVWCKPFLKSGLGLLTKQEDELYHGDWELTCIDVNSYQPSQLITDNGQIPPGLPSPNIVNTHNYLIKALEDGNGSTF